MNERKMVEYRIIYGWDNIAENINDAMKNGWEPLGGISVTYDYIDKEILFAQAMVKYES